MNGVLIKRLIEKLYIVQNDRMIDWMVGWMDGGTEKKKERGRR